MKLEKLLKKILFLQMYMWLIFALIYVNRKNAELSDLIPVLMIVNGIIMGILALMAKSDNDNVNLAGFIFIFINLISAVADDMKIVDMAVLSLNIICFGIYTKKLISKKKKEIDSEISSPSKAAEQR